MIRLGIHIGSVEALRAALGGPALSPWGATHAAWLGGADYVVLPWGAPGIVEALRSGGIALPAQVEARPEEADAAALKGAGVARVVLARREGHGPSLPLQADALRTPAMAEALAALAGAGVPAAVLVEPDEASLVAANGAEAAAVVLCTERYGGAAEEDARLAAFHALARAARSASELGLRVAAGRGLDLATVSRVAALPEVEAVEVGRAVASRAFFRGFQAAVAEMRDRVVRARGEEAPQS